MYALYTWLLLYTQKKQRLLKVDMCILRHYCQYFFYLLSITTAKHISGNLLLTLEQNQANKNKTEKKIIKHSTVVITIPNSLYSRTQSISPKKHKYGRRIHGSYLCKYLAMQMIEMAWTIKKYWVCRERLRLYDWSKQMPFLSIQPSSHKESNCSWPPF